MHNVGPCNTCADGVCGVQSVGETGLLYARARYYDPASGQFISRDPVEGEARLPITWGAYQYCRYNPYRYVDPNGEQSTSTMMTTLQKDVAASPAPSTPWATATSAAVGGALGAGSVPLANAIKSSLDRRTVARALAKELQTTEPVLAAKTPTIEAAKVRPEVSDTTPTLVAEGPRLRATGEGQSATRTARAVPSEGPCCFAPGTLVSTEEGDRSIETIQVGERVWTRMEDGSGEAFLAPVTATITHSIMNLSDRMQAWIGTGREKGGMPFLGSLAQPSIAPKPLNAAE